MGKYKAGDQVFAKHYGGEYRIGIVIGPVARKWWHIQSRWFVTIPIEMMGYRQAYITNKNDIYYEKRMYPYAPDVADTPTPPEH